MKRAVFISYSRTASGMHARALAEKLGELAFLDISEIDDGVSFPQSCLDGVLDASVVVLFATETYLKRRFCRLEMRLALAGSNEQLVPIVLALGDGHEAVLDLVPMAVAETSWPRAEETDRLVQLVHALYTQQIRTAFGTLLFTEPTPTKTL